MTRKEIVERAITFSNPPRVPFKFDVVGVNDCYDVWTHDRTGWTWDFDDRRAEEAGCVGAGSAVRNTGQGVGDRRGAVGACGHVSPSARAWSAAGGGR